MKKKKVLFVTDYCGIFTGFGRNCKELLTYLYKNYDDQIEIMLAATGMGEENSDFSRFPWPIKGVIPNDPILINRINQDANLGRMCAYGSEGLENLVYSWKPDILVGINDAWACNFYKSKSFAKHVPIIIHETVDSRPVLAMSIDNAKFATEYWSWAEFPFDEFEKAGIKIKCQYPCINTDVFYRLTDSQRLELRQKFNISKDAFIYGYVFRSQPRKLVNKLIEGYSFFKKQHPEIKNTFLLCFTNWAEGWNIPDLAKQYNVDLKEILCCYVCKETREYFISPFQGQDLINPRTGKKSLVTVNIQNGISEAQLNEVYNLMDLYLSPSNSGGCELGIMESSLAELPVAVPDYSYGEDVIKYNRGAVEMDFTFYGEIGTNFLKANPNPNSIAKIMYKFYTMKPEKIREMGRLSREWALANYSTEINGKKIAEALLAIPSHDWDFNRAESTLKNDKYPIPDISDDIAWLRDLYKNMLQLDLPPEDKGMQDWLQSLKNGTTREQIHTFFIRTAQEDNNRNLKVNFEDLLDRDDKGKRILFSIKQSAGDLVLFSALLNNAKQIYPNYNFYLATDPQYFDILSGHPAIHKMIPWSEETDQELLMVGAGTHKGYFEIAFCPAALTQKFLNYLRNGIDSTDIQFK